MDQAIVWGVILTMWTPGQPPIIDPNFKGSEMERCEEVKAELETKFPGYSVYCTPTYKPDSPPPRRKIVRKPVAKKVVRR